MDMGALLSMVLSCSGMSVPLQSVAEHMRKGGSSGMACSVLSSVVTGDCEVNMSSVDPTVLVSSTENLLVRWGVDFTIDWPKNPLWALLPSLLHFECPLLLQLLQLQGLLCQPHWVGQANPLLPRFWEVT